MLHHRKPNRLHGFNYAQDLLYFITTCVHNRLCVFGEVIDDQMVLNECGMIADRQWRWLENQYSYVRVHTHVVMPNHVHAIIEINRKYTHTCNDQVGTGRDLSLPDHCRTIKNGTMNTIATTNTNGTTNKNGTYDDPSLNQIKIKSLPELIGAYKTTSSKQIHLMQAHDGSYLNKSFCWQRSFHDRIIRNQKEYEKIYAYIVKNPMSWTKDEFYK